MGCGPGLVILHGGMRASQHYLRLAEALAQAFSVYIPDRRGRGLSGPPGEDYSIQKELEDLQALLHKTNAQMLFGHSAGLDHNAPDQNAPEAVAAELEKFFTCLN